MQHLVTEIVVFQPRVYPTCWSFLERLIGIEIGYVKCLDNFLQTQWRRLR